jgi:hypothetical protein
MEEKIWRHNFQHNDTEHNDTQQKGTKEMALRITPKMGNSAQH